MCKLFKFNFFSNNPNNTKIYINECVIEILKEHMEQFCF